MILGTTYVLANKDNEDVQVSATSTGTANVQTVTIPKATKGMFIACITNGGYFVFDGSTPDATNGLPVQDGAAPLFVPLGYPAITNVKFVSDLAGNCVAHFLFLG